MSNKEQSWLEQPLLKGFFSALLISLILILLLALVFYFTRLSESHLSTMATIVLIVSVFGGGITAARLTESKFLFYGWGVGLAYLFFAVLVSILSGVSFAANPFLTKLLYCSLGGIAGGITGAFLKQT